MNLKNINCGSLIKKKVEELDIDITRIVNFLKCSEDEVSQMYESTSIDSEVLLKWSKLLEYDFFRLYTQHLILYSPQSNTDYNLVSKKKSKLPQFRKNVYTKETIDFILELINDKEKTKLQIIKEYKIPKTTLYKWIIKYNLKNDDL